MSVADQLAQRPAASVGAPLGTLGDWRLGVEILLPSDPLSRWGIARWGQQKWANLVWHDLTPYVRGMTWARGTTELGGRADVGVAELTLDNRDRAFSPWNGQSAFRGATTLAPGNDADGYRINPAYLGPGTIIRIVAHSPSGQHSPITAPGDLDVDHPNAWACQMVGMVETWSDATDGRGNEGWASVTFVEAAAALAKINDNALPNVVGLNDTVIERVERLLAESDWHFGPVEADPNQPAMSHGLQSTNLAQNRLSELYLTGDSVGATVRASRNGGIAIYDAPGANDGPERASLLRLSCADEPDFVVDIAADTVTVTADDFGIVNTASIGHKGATPQTATDRLSIIQYGRRPFTRTDLIGRSDAVAQAIADQLVAERSTQTLRLESVGITHRSRNGALAQIGFDLDDTIDVRLADIDNRTVIVPNARVGHLDHNVTFQRNGIANWSTTVTFGISDPVVIGKELP